MQAQHEAIKKISWLIGKWVGKNGKGIYPTIKSFDYKETLEVLHPEPAQPVLHLKFSSWFEDEKGQKKFAHFETGFLKVKPGSQPVFLTYTSSHNNGLTLIEEGSLDEEKSLITLDSINVGRCSINKPPAVEKTKRTFQFISNEKFQSKMFMSTSTHPELVEHLFIEYERDN